MNKHPYFKRIVAYVIDLLIISLLSGILMYMIPQSRYESYSDNYSIYMDMLKNPNGYEDKKEYEEKLNEISYDISKNTVDISLVTCGLSLAYYCLFAYFNNGQTIGKKITRIKVVSNNGKKLRINNYLLRTLYIDRILMDITLAALIMFLSKKTYLDVQMYVSNFFSACLVVSFVFMMYRNDGRGLHDMISNTKVVNCVKGVPEIVDDEIEENINKLEEEIKYEELPNTIQIDDKEEQKTKKSKKGKSKIKEKVNEAIEGEKENERA